MLRLALLVSLLQVGQIQVPQPTGLVNDFAHVLDAQSVAMMTQIASDVRTKSRGEMTVVTLPTLDGRDVSEVALQIGRQWKLGKMGNPGDATRNAGAVILLVPKETSDDGHGHCWVSTGNATEGFVTDAMAGDICREATPFFMQRQYGAGLELVTYRVAQKFAGEYGFALDTTLRAPEVEAPRRSSNAQGGGIPPFFWLILFFVIISLLNRGGRRRGCLPIFIPFGGGGGGGGFGGGGGWSGGGGGGFGGFGGGGGFSGGGGGSSW